MEHMLLYRDIISLRKALSEKHATAGGPGFVPTMGALHRGHISLVERAINENHAVAVSLFVNPTQFNDPADFNRYPRDTGRDLEVLKQVLREDDMVFVPGVEEIYPEPDRRKFDFGGLDRYMEGKHRPGHFNGVAQVVTRLFEIVQPQRAYFGEKDFQQMAIIRYITRTLKLPVEIVACPIVREPDGLAMSSRNVLLSESERKEAALISQTLFRAREMYPGMPLGEVRDWVTGYLNTQPHTGVEYFEIVDDRTLEPLKEWKSAGGMVGCVAVRLGKVRLIDNVRFSL